MKETEQLEIFSGWLKAHKGLLFKIVRVYAFSVEDRDDLFQEISLQVWRSVPNFRGESAVTTWLYRIALNTALRWKSKEYKRLTGNNIDNYQSVIYEEPAAQDDKVLWLYHQIAKLSEVDRSLCLLLLDDFSYKEIGEIIGISEGNVAVKIHRIKKYLTKQSKRKKSAL